VKGYPILAHSYYYSAQLLIGLSCC